MFSVPFGTTHLSPSIPDADITSLFRVTELLDPHLSKMLHNKLRIIFGHVRTYVYMNILRFFVHEAIFFF